MTILTGLLQIAAVVVVASGAAKIESPTAFADLLAMLAGPREIRPEVMSRLARGAGLTELALGTCVLVVGGTIPALVLGAAYVVFAAVAERARRAGATTCGCFGSMSTPPNVLHVVVNLVAAVVCIVAAIGGATDDILTVVQNQPFAGIPYVIVVLAGAAGVIGLDTVSGRPQSPR